MSYAALLIPCPCIPANFMVSSVVAQINSEIASAAAAQAVSAAASSQAAAAVNASVSATATAALSGSTSVSATAASATAASSTAASSTAAAFGSIALPVAISILAVLIAGMAIDIARAQRELRRCHKLTIETVFSSKEQLIEALFKYSDEEECRIYEEEDGSLIVRYQLEDYFFRMNNKRGCFDLEIVNSQHPMDELEKINKLQLCYMEAVRQHCYDSLMEQIVQQGWTLERNETAEDGSMYISILV